MMRNETFLFKNNIFFFLIVDTIQAWETQKEKKINHNHTIQIIAVNIVYFCAVFFSLRMCIYPQLD